MNIATPVFAGNWKLNNGPTATRAFFRDFLPRLPEPASGTVVICPPALSLTAAVTAIGDRRDIVLGVQNIHWQPEGAFTGEISAPLARDTGASLVLVGHSERRHIFGETDEESRSKVRAALDAGMIAVLCVGETLVEREAGRAFQMVEQQLAVGMESVTSGELDHFLVAYEPVWAIGTGRTASPADASDMHGQIRDRLEATFGPSAADIPILYGGSVKPDNAGDLLRAPGIGGLLIGGASLDPAGFADICSLAP